MDPHTRDRGTAGVPQSSADGDDTGSALASPAALSLLEPAALEAAVSAALRCEPAALRLLHCHEKSGSAASGFLSTCGSLTVRAAVQGGGDAQPEVHTLHLFAKRQDAAEVAAGLDSFNKECAYFSKLRPVLEKAWRRGHVGGRDIDSTDLGPAVYLGTSDLIVMEDLTAQGYRAVPQGWFYDGLDHGIILQTLRAMARIHASSLVATRLDGVSLATVDPELLIEHFFTRRPGSVGRRLFDISAALVADYMLPRAFPRLAVPQTGAELRRLQDLVRDAFLRLDSDLVRAAEPLLVVNHGDVWPNNVLFKTDEQGQVNRAVLVDYQMVRLMPPAFDVMFFLAVNTRRDFRRQHLKSLLRTYYADLQAFCRQRGLDITEDLSLPAFLSSAERVSAQCRVINCAYLPSLVGDDADMARLFADGDARTKFLLDIKVRGPLTERWWDSCGERYREPVTEAIEELLDLPPGNKAPSQD